MRGEIIADFSVDHRVKSDKISIGPWKIYFNESIWRDGKGIGNVLI
jgi:hypothetical protein